MPFTRPNPAQRKSVLVSILMLWLWAFLSPPVQSADDPSSQSPQNFRRHLLLVAKKSLVVQHQLDELLKKPASKENSKKIESLQSQLDKLDVDFESMATQLSLQDPSLKKKKKTDWLEELQELTKPLLNAIRDITKKPRMIDDLKNKIAELETRAQLYGKAARNLEMIFEAEKSSPTAKNPEGEKYLARLNMLKNKYDPELIRFNLIKSRRDLNEALASDESILDAATRTIQDFLKNRGRNLLVTFTTFFGLWWVLIRIRKWVTAKKFLAQLNPSLGKLLNAAYNVVVLLICLLAGLACLFFFNDWLLISLIVVILILVAWTSRQWIPKFLQEIKLIVNLGTVREGERMIWKGIPWLVRDIGLQATLVNERLEGGEIKFPVSELIDQHSRQVVKNESWFPTKPGDWVILSDSTYGKSINQTMEQVVLRLKGGALKYYATTDFLAQTPLNISEGFRYSIEFGLDYGVQAGICDEIPTLFESGLKNHLKNRFGGLSPDFNYVEVRFDNAGASSLNLMVIVHVEGRCAELHEEYQREIQTTLVKICNENGLVIPFNRLTINLAKEDLDQTKNSAAPKDQST